jgi:hypothetical protein
MNAVIYPRVRFLYLVCFFAFSLPCVSFSQRVTKIKIIDKDMAPKSEAISVDSMNTLLSRKTVDFIRDSQVPPNASQLKQFLDSLKNNPEKDTGKNVTIMQEISSSSTCPKIEAVTNLILEKDEDGNYQFSLTDVKENPLKTFILKEMNERLFKEKLKENILSLCDETDNKVKKEVDSLVDILIGEGLYRKILEASLNVRSNDILAGKLNISKMVEVSYYKDTIIYLNGTDKVATPKIDKRYRKFIDPPFTVYSIQIQFQDGYIENIKVKGKMNGMDSMLLFANPFPIPFSSKTNFELDAKLFEVTRMKKARCSMDLGELLQFDYNLRNYTRDYFPENQVYKAELNDSITTVSLYREKTTRILEVKVFSDLKGIDTDNPNGLIQTEFSKSFNFLTNRRNWLAIRVNYGYLNYFTPEFTLNKIEDNNKQLVLDHFEKQPANVEKPNSFASTLDLYRHQIYSIGFSVNLFLLDAPELKSTFFLCTGVYFGRSAIQDTLRAYENTSNSFKPINDNNVMNFGVNTFQIAPEIKWQIFPDERYGVCLSQKLRYVGSLSDDFQQVESKNTYINFLKNNPVDNVYKHTKFIWNSEVCAFFKPSANNQLFIRYRLNYDLGNMNHNFGQLQVGVTTWLTTTKKVNETADGR